MAHACTLSPLDSLRRLQNIGGGKMIGRTCNKSATPPPRKRCSPGVRVACVQKNAHTQHSESLPTMRAPGVKKKTESLLKNSSASVYSNIVVNLHSFFPFFAYFRRFRRSRATQVKQVSDERRLLLGFLQGAVHRARHAVLPS